MNSVPKSRNKDIKNIAERGVAVDVKNEIWVGEVSEQIGAERDDRVHHPHGCVYSAVE